MSTESAGDRPAQCSVPNITFSTESSNLSSFSGGPTTPNMPVVLLARPRDPQSFRSIASESQRSAGDMAPVSLLQRPLSAPTSLESSSSHGSSAAPLAMGIPPEPTGMDVDASIVEALKSSKDRLYVLKLGETMEGLISQGILFAKVELQPASSYQRLLVHRCAAFYHLTQESSQNSVAVIVTADSRIPSKRISELVPPEESVLPAFQIMRRVDRSKAASRATSVDGSVTDDGDDSTRSQGSGSKKKQHMTMEERAAAYKEARSRIFMDFDEKDASASSNGAISSAASTVSYTGGSTGMSSVDGDGASTAPTESEYSGPAGQGKDSWYGGPFSGSDGRVNQMGGGPPVNTTLRSTAPPFTSPNVAPPPPNGTVHYIQPMAESNGNQEIPGHIQSPGAPPVGSYAAYPAPAIYPYYMPYLYPFPYAQPVSFPPPSHGSASSQEMQGQDNNQQPQQPPAAQLPPGFGPPMAHPIPAQPYPGYVWMAPAPGFIPVPSHTVPTHQPNPTAQPQPSGSTSNISRPASQGSHVSFDPRSQPQTLNAPHQHPTPQQQHQQVHNYGTYHAQSNTFQSSHQQQSHNLMSPNRAPMPMHAGPPPPMHANMQNQHPARPHPLSASSSYNSQHGPIGPPGPSPPQPNSNGQWGNRPHTVGAPNGTVMSPGSRGGGNILPPTLPGRPQGPTDGNWPLNGSGAPGGIAGPKRGGPRTSWGSYSYGPGVGVGGMHTLNSVNPGGVVGGVLRAPEGLNIRVLPAITLDGHSTGSSNGSSSSARKRNMASGAGNMKSPVDETSSVTSSSSSSSKRTYTSTASSQPPQHHPLPERPDWVMGTRPQPGGAIYNRSKGTSSSNNSSSRSLLPPSSTGAITSSGTPSPVSNPGQLSSTSSSVSGGDPLAKEFPPLVNDGKVGTPSRPSPGGAWNNAGSTKAAVTGVGVESPPSRAASSSSRFDEPDKKFERPPLKTGAALFNPRVPGPSRSKSRDSTQAANTLTDDLSQTVAAISLNDDEQNGTAPPESAEVEGGGREVVC